MPVIRGGGEDFEPSDVFSKPLFAHLATSSAEGVRESPCWFLWEDDSIWIIGEKQFNSFLVRVEADPRVAVGIVDFDVSSGCVRHVGVRGRASLHPWDPERARRLLSRYLGPDPSLWDKDRFQSNLEPRDDLVFVRVEPVTMVVRDQSYPVLGKSTR